MMSKLYDIKSTEQRLQTNKDKGHQHINKFLSKITDSLQSITNNIISKDMVDIILLYSNHKQICTQWHTICDKLGAFAYLIETPCSIDDITNFERKLTAKSEQYTENTFNQLPDDVRLSLMICGGYKISIFTKENPLNKITDWKFGDEACIDNPIDVLIPNNWVSYLLGYSNVYCSDLYTDLNFFNIFEPCAYTMGYIQDTFRWFGKSRQKIPADLTNKENFMVQIGSCSKPLGINFSFWNPANNKIYVGEVSGADIGGSCSHLQFSKWILSQTNDYTQIPYFIDVYYGWYQIFKNIEELKEHLLDSLGLNYEYKTDCCLDVLCDMYISQVYKTEYNPLVVGYMREKSKEYKCDIPMYIVNRILMYFPYFIDCNISKLCIQGTYYLHLFRTQTTYSIKQVWKQHVINTLTEIKETNISEFTNIMK
eukprot:284704_1